MKFFVLVLLMMILPAQATLAAVENAHGHTFALEHHNNTTTPSEGDEHHTSCADKHAEQSKTTSHCEQGHHHCHAANLGVLPDVATLHVDVNAWRLPSDRRTSFQSFLDSRIERPNWA